MSLARSPFTFALPIVWTVLSAASFCYPGDEYGKWGTTSIAGTWILWITPSSSSGHPSDSLPWVLISGFAVMAVLGLLLDRLRSRRNPFMVTWLVLATLFIVNALRQYPSFHPARMGSFSIPADVLSIATFTLTATAFLFLMIAFAKRLFHQFRAPVAGTVPMHSNG